MAKPFSKFLSISGFKVFVFSSKVLTKFSMASLVGQVSLSCHQRLFVSPNSVGCVQQSQGAWCVVLLVILVLQNFNFLCARSTGERCGAISKEQATKSWLMANASLQLALRKVLLMWDICSLWWLLSELVPFCCSPQAMAAKSGKGAGMIHVWDSSDGIRDLAQEGVWVWWWIVLCDIVGIAAPPCYNLHVLSSENVNMHQKKIFSRNSK